MTDEELAALGKELPWERPDAGRREAVRSSLLVEAAERTRVPRGRSWTLAGGGFVAGAAAAALLVLWLMRRDVRPPDVSHAEIQAVAQANFEREVTATTSGTDEIVRLHTGTLRLAVGALPAGDRVRVKTGNAEVEGAGDYEVAVAGDEITEVKVRTGSAKVTVSGQQAVFLAAGESWTAPVVTARVDVAPTQPEQHATPPTTTTNTEPPVASISSPTTGTATGRRMTSPGGTSGAKKTAPVGDALSNTVSPESPSPTTVAPPQEPQVATATRAPVVPDKRGDTKHAAIEHYFQAGYALLREGKADQAATELAAAAELDPDDALANDARYFQAVALVKARRPAEAEKALVAFLDHAKTSLRRGRASVMLGRLLADRGDRTSARAWFEAATADADPEVVSAARAGLDALGK